MPVDNLGELNDLMPDKLDLEPVKTGHLPLTPLLGSEKVWRELGYAEGTARMLFQPDRAKASDPKQPLWLLPNLVRTTVQIATFKATIKLKATHQHLFLTNDYSGTPTTSFYTWTQAEVLFQPATS